MNTFNQATLKKMERWTGEKWKEFLLECSPETIKALDHQAWGLFMIATAKGVIMKIASRGAHVFNTFIDGDEVVSIAAQECMPYLKRYAAEKAETLPVDERYKYFSGVARSIIRRSVWPYLCKSFGENYLSEDSITHIAERYGDNSSYTLEHSVSNDALLLSPYKGASLENEGMYAYCCDDEYSEVEVTNQDHQVFAMQNHCLENIRHLLSPREYLAFRLLMIDQKDPAEVSSVLNCTRRTLSNYRNSIKDKLSDLLVQSGGNPETALSA